jgi:hypothetical protein
MGTQPTDRLRDKRRFEEHPELAVLSTDRDEPADQVTAGAALERVLLAATRAGVTASFLNQPLEYDELRTKVQRLTDRPGFAHMIIRFGRGPHHSGTARRPIADFLSKEQS